MQDKSASSDLASRLEAAEEALDTLRRHEADAIVGANGVMFLQSLERIRQDTLARRALEELLDARTAMLTATLAQAEDEAHFRAMADEAPVMIWVAGPDQARTWVNRSWLEFTGRSFEQELGDDWTEDVHPDDRPGFLAAYQDGFARHAGFELEYRLRQSTGEYRWVLARSVPRFGPAGEFRGMIGCCTDITPIKTLTQQLAEAIEAAQQASRAKSAFVANMSHEIRTPLNAILGMAHLLRKDGVTPKQAERLDHIDAAANHLLKILNDVLDLSKIEAGKMALEDTEIDLQVVLGNVASLLTPLANAQGIQLIMDTQQVPYRLRGDPTRLAQALLNLGNNAIKFTERGSIAIRTRLLDSSDERVQLRFEVEDVGIGIAPETLGKLFSPFEQADNSTTRAYGGTGLGLTITRSLAQLMDGEAGASSVPGQGSTFWFTAWLRKTSKTADPTAATELQDNSPEVTLAREYHGCRILLVEDEPMNQMVVIELLSDTGLIIDSASDGAEAVDMVARQPYDLVLMDIQMPHVDGFEATRSIRAMPGHQSLPIIAMTANAFDDDRARCLHAGMNDFLSKPVLPEHLFIMLLKWLRKIKRP